MMLQPRSQNGSTEYQMRLALNLKFFLIGRMQLCCRKLAIWMGGTIHVGSILKLFGHEFRPYNSNDYCKFHGCHKSKERDISLPRRIILHSMRLGSSTGTRGLKNSRRF